MKKIKSLVISFMTLSMMIFVSASGMNAADSNDYLSLLSADELEVAEKESVAIDLAEDIKDVYSDQDYGSMYTEVIL